MYLGLSGKDSPVQLRGRQLLVCVKLALKAVDVGTDNIEVRVLTILASIYAVCIRAVV